MVTEALSSEETTVEVAITAVSGLSSYFSAVVALAVAATAITAADVAAAADLHFYCGSFRPAAFYDFSVFFISHFGIRSLLLSLMFPVCLYQSDATFLSSNHHSLLAGKWQDRNP